jgi:hypothetical protein
MTRECTESSCDNRELQFIPRHRCPRPADPQDPAPKFVLTLLREDEALLTSSLRIPSISIVIPNPRSFGGVRDPFFILWLPFLDHVNRAGG